MAPEVLALSALSAAMAAPVVESVSMPASIRVRVASSAATILNEKVSSAVALLPVTTLTTCGV